MNARCEQLHAADAAALSEARTALSELTALKQKLEEDVASATAQLVSTQTSAKQRTAALEAQLKDSEAALADLSKQNGLLYTQIQSLGEHVDRSLRPADVPDVPTASGGSSGSWLVFPVSPCVCVCVRAPVRVCLSSALTRTHLPCRLGGRTASQEH